MRGTIRGIVLSICMLSHGCGTLLATQWPSKPKRRVVQREGRVAVRGAPTGAIVTTADGKTVLGPAPMELVAEYDVVLTWKERSYWGAGIGAGLAWLAWGFSFTQLLTTKESGEPYSRVWLVMTGVGIADAMSATLRIPVSIQQNMAARTSPTRTPMPVDVPYRVRWQGFDPVDLTVRFPDDTSVVATRPTEVSFDQALIYWERAGARAPSPAVLFELGRAYLERAETHRDAEAAAKAIVYLEQYLATGQLARDARAQAEALLAQARELGR